jgi:hypothetical protein
MIHMLLIGTMLEHKQWIFHIGVESKMRGIVALRLFPLLSSMFVVDMIVDVWLMNLMEKGWISFACDCLGGVLA